MEGNELYRSYYVHVQFNFFSDYAWSLMFITLVAFSISANWSLQVSSAWENCDVGLHAVIRHLCLKGFPEEVHENICPFVQQQVKNWDA